MILWMALIMIWCIGMAPSIHWLDTAELSLSTYVFGVGHPPGQPAYVMLTSFVQWLPLGDIGFRTTCGSLLMSILSAQLTYFCVTKYLLQSGWRVSFYQKYFIIFCVLGFSLSPIIALQAIRPELYALATALTCGCICLTLFSYDRRYLMSGWVCWTLAASVHPVISLFAVPFLLRKGFLQGFLIAVFVALHLLFLPLRAEFFAPWNFGNPHTWTKFVWFLRGDLYAAFGGGNGSSCIHNFWNIVMLIGKSVQPIMFIFAFGGWFSFFLKERWVAIRFAMGAIILILMLSFTNNFWPTNPDAYGYIGIIVWFLASMACFGFFVLWKWISSKWVVLAWSVSVMIWCFFQLIRYGNDVVLSRDWSAHRHMHQLIEEMEPKDIVSTASFSSFSFLRYAQIVEGLRPDVKIFYRGLLDSRPDPDIKSHLWELAIHRNRKGLYTVRDEDKILMSQLTPHGWFYRLESSSVFSEQFIRDTLRKNTMLVKNDMPRSLDFAQESLILNYLLHILFYQYKDDSVMKKAMLIDMKYLFPLFEDYDLLEQKNDI